MRKEDAPNISQNEDIEMLLMSKSMPLSVIAKSIAEQRESKSVTILQRTGDSFSQVKIGHVGDAQSFLFDGMMAVYEAMSTVNDNGIIEIIDLNDNIIESLQQLVASIKKASISRVGPAPKLDKSKFRCGTCYDKQRKKGKK